MRAFCATLLFAIGLGFGPNCSADIVYTLTNLPSEQDGANLNGFIRTDGTLGSIGAGNIVGWAFSVNKPGVDNYIAASIDTGASFDLGLSVLQASESQLALSGSLTLLSLESGPTLPTSVLWQTTPGTEFYFSNSRGNSSSGWENLSPTSFGGEPWVIATAVPEPSSAVLLGGLGLCWMVRRRRAPRDRSTV